MPVLIQNNASEKFTPSFAPSTNVGLCLRANGDEQVIVIDPFGYAVPAGIHQPSNFGPTVLEGTGDGVGHMNEGKWVGYAYCWAASRRYPYVEGQSVGGNLYPRGNPTPGSLPFQITAAQKCDVSFDLPDNITPVNTSGQVRSDLDRVWIVRTLDFDTEEACQLAINAGDFYYVDLVVVPPNTPPNSYGTYTDLYQTPTDDLIEYDNYEAPQFQFCIYVDPYWYGFGNFPLKVKASWDVNGNVTLDNTDPNAGYYQGRAMQPCYIKAEGADDNITNLNRQYYAKDVGDYFYCQLVIDLDQTPVSDFSAGSGFIVFNGPSTTLYRSKYRNPLAWGTTDFVGDIRVPSQFVLKVGGGIGTGIAQVPNMPLLVLSTKGPAATYTLDLRTAGSDQFPSTLKCISTLFSVTSHFSQFPAMLPNGSMILYGHDADNMCIIACDGNSVQAVSDPALSATMRRMTDDPVLLRKVHGLYDPNTQHNCMWLPMINAIDTMNMLAAQSSVTGGWRTQYEGDVLSGAVVESTFCSLRKLYLGTRKGHFGTGLDDSKTRNWLYDQFQASGIVQVVTQNTIVLETAIPKDAPGLIGLWVLIVDIHGGGDLWMRISAVSDDGLTLATDRVWSPGNGNTPDFGPDVTLGNTHQYYVGVIECTMEKFFDFNMFSDDKKLEELWMTMLGVDPANPTKMQFIRDRGRGQPGVGQNYYVITSEGNQSTLIAFEQVKYDDNETSQQWFTQAPPTERTKVFGLRIVDRGYGKWRLFGWGGKIV